MFHLGVTESQRLTHFTVQQSACSVRCHKAQRVEPLTQTQLSMDGQRERGIGRRHQLRAQKLELRLDHRKTLEHGHGDGLAVAMQLLVAMLGELAGHLLERDQRQRPDRKEC